MQIKKLIETEKGAVEFSANLAPEEVSFLLEFAINYFMKQGAIPFALQNGAAMVTKIAPNTTESIN